MQSRFNQYMPQSYFLALAVAAPLVFSSAAHALDQKTATISVTASGTATLAPDVAIVPMKIYSEGDTARQAISENSKAIDEVLVTMKKWGVSENDIQTSSFKIRPRYNHSITRLGRLPKVKHSRVSKQNIQNSNSNMIPAFNGSTEKLNSEQEPRRIIGHDVSSGLNVHVRDLSVLGDILDEAVILSVNNDDSIRFSNSNPDTAYEQAKKIAVAEAFEQARILSSAAGVNLGSIVRINETPQAAVQFSSGGRIGLANGRPLRLPISLRENTYSATVTVVWEIVQ